MHEILLQQSDNKKNLKCVRHYLNNQAKVKIKTKSLRNAIISIGHHLNVLKNTNETIGRDSKVTNGQQGKFKVHKILTLKPAKSIEKKSVKHQEKLSVREIPT